MPSLNHSFEVYDADAYAPCRYHLIQRAKAQPTLLTPTTTASAASSLPLPGAASRWRMSADVTGLDRHAHMLRQVDDMYQAYTLYYFLQVWGGRASRVGRGQHHCRQSTATPHLDVVFSYNDSDRHCTSCNLLQGIILLMLIMHFIHAIGFQPRLSVIPGGCGSMQSQRHC